MKTTPLIVPQMEIPISTIPHWDQFSPEHQHELIQALAELLLHLPQLQALEEGMRHEHQP
jgi:hypothetical protein